MVDFILINPDNYLDTPNGRIWTPERNDVAWQLSYDQLSRSLKITSMAERRRLYIVFGVQAAGKSTWISQNSDDLIGCIVFDAALPRVTHRKRIIDEAKQAGFEVHAVLLMTDLETALDRNQQRAPDIRVPEDAIRSVMAQLEGPQAEEGFTSVKIIRS